MWAAALVAAEYLGLSLCVDFPTHGRVLRLVAGARILAPILLGAGAAGLLIARSGLAPTFESPPAPSRRWAALAAHLCAFAITAVLALRWFREGAVGPSELEFGLWLASAAVAALLAVPIAVAPGWALEVVLRHGWVPVLSVGAGVLSWRALVAADGLWGVLQGATLHSVAWLLGTLGRDVRVDLSAASLGVGGFEVSVAPECSGTDGLGLVLVFEAVWLSLARRRIRVAQAAGLLLPLGAAAAFCANVLRIAVLVLIGAAGHESLAVQGFHSKLGWVLFVAIAFATIAAAERLPWLAAASANPGEGGVPPEAASHVAPLLAALATALVTSLFVENGIDRWYAARILAAGILLLANRSSLPRPALDVRGLPLLIGAGVTVLWVLWPGSQGSTLGAALAELTPGSRAGWIAARLMGSVLVIPVVEELAFRGFLLPWLSGPATSRSRRRSWAAIAVSSLAFGAIHEPWLRGAIAGVAFAAARQWRGRLGDAILAHSAANAGVAIAALGFGRTDLWG